jgi:FKBP-type peptidyl-prolyl cis-trans isomerase FkpA
MRLNVYLLFLLYIGTALTACSSQNGTASIQTPASGAPQTEDQKTLYALGHGLAQNVNDAGLTEAEIATVIQGFSDSALKRPSKVEMRQYGPKVQAFMTGRLQAAATEELIKSLEFIEEQEKVQGAVRTPSGIVIQEIKAGTGATPKATDTVKVHYQGTLRDGTVFDSSVTGEPVQFGLNMVIPCWTEGVQQIKVGGKSRLICPPNLAYGPNGQPGIPGNAALAFEVELLEIVSK